MSRDRSRHQDNPLANENRSGLGTSSALGHDARTPDRSIAGSSSTEGLPVAPSMGLTLQSVVTPQMITTVGSRVVFLSVIAILIGLAAGVVAQILLALIGLITNLSFYGRLTTQFFSPA